MKIANIFRDGVAQDTSFDYNPSRSQDSRGIEDLLIAESFNLDVLK